MTLGSRFISAALFAFALLALHMSASALTTEHGTVCKVYGNSSTPGLYSYTNGAFNYSGASLGVACPVVRTAAAGSGGFSVWVDGTAASGTAYCSLYSYDFTGSYLGSSSFNATGTFDRLVTLPQSQVPTYSSQMVYCYLPANGGVYDIEPVQ